MKRFYFERREGSYLIFDRSWNNVVPIASTGDGDIAEMICTALNLMWEKPQ
jgi:hypothetical protein